MKTKVVKNENTNAVEKNVVKLEERKYSVRIEYKDGKITYKHYGSHKKAYAYAERKWNECNDTISSINIDFTATIYEQWTAKVGE